MTVLLDRLRAAVADAPDPAGATAWLERFAEAASLLPGGLDAQVVGAEAEALLVAIVAQSPHLARQLVGDPRRLGELALDPCLRRAKPAAQLRVEVEAAIARDGLHAGLRRVCAAERLRLGAREIGWGRFEDVARELSHLAGACLDAAVFHLRRELEERLGPPLTDDGGAPRPCRFAVLGLGKLGGEELNFSSDIDLIYLYESDAGGAGALRLNEWFSRLAERLTRAISDITDEGTCFRVDLRLRPEGTRGPLVNSLPALERYYETWGRPWERQAWIRARPVAGDRDLGEEALRTLAPFVWPRASSSGADAATLVGGVVGLLGRARATVDGERDLKLGPGGIREVEFFAQALQLLHGGRQPALRQASTLRALDRLLFAGLISEREHRGLGDAYLLLRRVEHRLQLVEMRQTHALPADEEGLRILGRRLGFASAEAFSRALAAARAEVSAIFATLGGPTAGPGLLPGLAELLDGDGDRASRVGLLAGLGFLAPEAALDELERLMGQAGSPFAPTASTAMAELAGALLGELAASPDPDQALRHLADLGARRWAAASLWRLLADRPAVARLLVSLLGSSDFLARLLLAYPDLVEPLLGAGDRHRPRSRAEQREAVFARLGADDEEAALEAVRRRRNEELLRIGLADIGGALDVEDVNRELGALAEACLDACLDVARRAVALRWGEPPPLAVIALGKLGGGELAYASDLDLLFVFADDGPGGGDERRFELASRLVQRLIRGLDARLSNGRLYEVDARLRPAGQKGALVSSLGGFRRYHEEEAALWERQALIKARAVAGDERLGEEVEAIVAAHVWRPGSLDDEAVAREIGRLRGRMEREIGREEGSRVNLKAGRGGLLDVEFLVQRLQLAHGPADPSLRSRATRPALESLARAGRIAEEERLTLDEGFAFLRRLESRLRIVHDRSLADIDLADTVELDRLARRMGYRGSGPGRALADEYRRRTGELREIYLRHLPAP